jgi:hypothetical protein
MPLRFRNALPKKVRGREQYGDSSYRHAVAGHASWSASSSACSATTSTVAVDVQVPAVQKMIIVAGMEFQAVI